MGGNTYLIEPLSGHLAARYKRSEDQGFPHIIYKTTSFENVRRRRSVTVQRGGNGKSFCGTDGKKGRRGGVEDWEERRGTRWWNDVGQALAGHDKRWRRKNQKAESRKRSRDVKYERDLLEKVIPIKHEGIFRHNKGSFTNNKWKLPVVSETLGKSFTKISRDRIAGLTQLQEDITNYMTDS